MDSNHGNNAPEAGGNDRGPTIDMRTLTVRYGSDGTVVALLPPDWSAGGGFNTFAACAPGESMAVTMSNGNLMMPMDPYSFFMSQTAPQCMLANPIIHSREPNMQLMGYLQQMGMPCQSEYFIGEALHYGNRPVRFCYMVFITQMMWTMSSGTQGFIARPDLFDRNFKELFTIAESVKANQGQLMAQQQQMLDRTRQTSRTISETSDIVWQGIQSQMQAQDRIIDKWSYRSAGEQAMYSPTENRIYVTGETTDYVQNPNYPNETLTSVPDHLWNKLPHERDWRY